MKKILITITLLALFVMLFSCGDTPSAGCTSHADANLDGKCDTCQTVINPESPPCTSHIDKDNNGKCDVCKETVQAENGFDDIALVTDGTPAFRFVLANDLAGDSRATLDRYKQELKSAGISVESVADKKEDYSGIEVLVGSVTGRGEKYAHNKYTLGKEGLIITAIDNKVIINGGTTESINIAIELFFENILGVELYGDNEIDNVVFTVADEIVEIQDNYSVSDVTVCGESILGRTIAADKSDKLYYDMAALLQDAIYTATGMYLELVPLENAASDSIIVERVPDDGEYGFKIYTDGDNLRVDCGFSNALEKTFSEFVNKNIKLASGVIAFDSDYLYAKNVRIVTYEEFGARGNGSTDDFLAIKAAHDYANECGQTVIGTPGKTYRIHNIVDSYGHAQPIKIRTDVVWEGVKFLIDDTGYTYKDANNKTIFSVVSDYKEISITDRETIEKIFSGTTIDMDFTGYLDWSDYGYEAMVSVVNADKKIFIRSGGNANDGANQSELIVVGADGKIRDDTPFMFDYENITGIIIRRMDERHITIKGGEFTTLANDTPMTLDDWGYFSRNFAVSRSYTVIDGLKHYIKGELPGVNVSGNTDPKGPPYGGFFSVNGCSDVTYKNGVLTGRRCSGIAGTYDFGAGTANNLYLYNVVQSNYYREDGVTPTMDYKYYWGIGGTNFCKNLTYDTCVLSRFDAHQGLYNGKIINSVVTNVEIIGAGDMLIENTLFTPISNTPIMLRGDYGCTWRGTVTIKDCTVKFKTASPVLINGGWNNHYYGYECYFPNIVIDNLKWEGISTKEVLINNLYSDDTVYTDKLWDGSVNNNIYYPPEFITVINCDTLILGLKDSAFFRGNTTLTGVTLFEVN